MLKTLFTLFRGAAHESEQAFIDRNALPLLRQQMRDATQAVHAARKAVAVAIAQNKQEAIQHEKLVQRLTDLENRAIAAIDQDRDDLAREAAETIALMEAERDVSEQAQSQFASEISRLKTNVQQAEMKLRELQRGQRLVTATDKAQKLRTSTAAQPGTALMEAEETLKRLRVRQTQLDLTDEALAEMSATGNPEAVTEKLAEAGCGAPLKTTADDVLERLRGKAEKTSEKEATKPKRKSA